MELNFTLTLTLITLPLPLHSLFNFPILTYSKFLFQSNFLVPIFILIVNSYYSQIKLYSRSYTPFLVIRIKSTQSQSLSLPFSHSNLPSIILYLIYKYPAWSNPFTHIFIHPRIYKTSQFHYWEFWFRSFIHSFYPYFPFKLSSHFPCSTYKLF